MTIFVLATGVLTADPCRRESQRGTAYTTATIRAEAGNEAILISLIAFGEHAPRLLEHSRGEPLSVSGKAKLTSWTARDGSEKHGIAVTIGEIAGVRPRPRLRTPTTKRPGSYSPSPKRSTVPEMVDDDLDRLFREPVA
jgi:single-stranded DNA-binding protein